MQEVLQAALTTGNLALAVCLVALAGCAFAHLLDRKERKERDRAAAIERETLYRLISDNTAAMHGLRQAISVLTSKDL